MRHYGTFTIVLTAGKYYRYLKVLGQVWTFPGNTHRVYQNEICDLDSSNITALNQSRTWTPAWSPGQSDENGTIIVTDIDNGYW